MRILLRHPLAEQVGRAIHGFGGGGSSGSSHGAVESPDNLQSIAFARVLDLWGEGEIAGFVHSTNVLQDVALNGTPVANADGSLNFQNVKFDSRSGTQSQSFMSGFPDVENETSVNVELKSTANWTQTLTDLTLTAVRVRLSMPAISQQDTTTGDIKGYTVQYAIDIATDGGSYQQCISSAFTGKSTSKYERAERVELPTATTGWTVRVRRLTANANSATIADTVMIESYTEITDGKFRYPNSAYGGLIIDASQFSSIPTRAYYMKGRIVSVPSNYDPVARTYTGTWDGTFKPAWTNNPAWIFYDLVTNSRFGLGDYVTAAMVNKWNLYTIAQYCDALVPDGFGGQEPRMTCNVFLQTQADAYKVMQDLASVFRGICYWAGGAIQPVADMPGDPVYTYTAANVIDGKFTYQGSGRKTRYTVALVSWNDQTDFGRAKVEYVSDDEGIARYGVQSTSVTAFGCSSRGQAHRVGLWTLYTSRLETGTVTFKVGLDGTIAAPGQIIRVQDPARAGKRQAGRISAATATAVTVDSAPTVAIGDSLTCTLPSGVTETHTVTAVSGNVISVAAPGFSTAPGAESVWVVESSSLVAETYRVVSVLEDNSGGQGGANDSGGTPISFTITAVQHNASKFDAIDFGDALMVPQVTAIPPTTQPGPASVTLTSSETAGNVVSGVLLTIAWPSTSNAVKYQVEWRKDNGEWQPLGGPVTGLSADLHNAMPGIYVARVRAINANGIGSVPTVSSALTVVDQTKTPTTVTTATNTANTANTTANTATQLAQQVNVINPGFDAGDTGWLKDAGWTIKTDGAGPGAGVGYAEYDATGSNAAIKNQALCYVTVAQTYKAQALIKAIGANGSAYVKIAWLDSSLNVIGSNTPGSVVTGTTTAGSYVVAQAPAGSVYGQVWIEVDGCTTGKYQVDNVVSTLQPSDLTEVPDGNGRYAAVHDPATQATQAAQIAAAYQPGQNIVPNPSFAIGCDQNNPIGWVIANGTGVVSSCQRNRSGFPTSLEIQTTATTAQTVVCYSDFFPLPSTGAISIQCRYDIDRTYVTGDASADFQFYDSTQTVHIGSSSRIFQASADMPAGQVAQVENVAIPAGTVYGRIRYFVEGVTRASDGNAVYVRTTDWKVEVGATCTPFSDYATTFGHDLVVAGSGRQIGDQRNLWPVTWAGVRSVLSSSPITYSINTASPATVTLSVAAFTNYGGGLNVSYNAASGSVSQARSTTATYYLYFRDPTSAGGSQTLHITTNLADLAQYPDAVNIGNATVTVAASGGGSGGGGGGGGFCVCDDMWVDEDTLAGEAQPGHVFDCCDLPASGTETFQRALQSVEYHDTECVRITTERGAVLDCGITTPFDTVDGRELRATEMAGELVLTDRGLERVQSVQPIGTRRVCFFHFGGISYAAGADPAHRIYSHNTGALKP